ncbi:MAG: succinyldiaminopimelate desuccinylase [Gammaproteobacteria bacterium]|jgi:succinyl-diaminopimelate desuccinylase|nr:succinyldiaminopimelate desuccinylase [Gammaproteobacteria bacterium]
MSTVLDIAKDLIRFPSVTPHDAGCQAYIAAKLKSLGFTIESMSFGDVTNLWARYGNKAPLLVFAGHTDVVPAGDLTGWHNPPFEPIIRDGYLYGRGSADMKGSIAAFLTACTPFLKKHPAPSGSIAFLLTSDEEGIAINGTAKVIETLSQRGEKIDYCLVGEPSSQMEVGDTLKIGRRGSLSGRLTVHGIQGHIAYPHLADNPIHKALAALLELSQMQWDHGNVDFPATTFQISNIQAGTGAMNVIPATLTVDFNLRHCPDSKADHLKEEITRICKRHSLKAEIVWQKPSDPFYSKPGKLREVVIAAIEKITQKTPELSTSGGTSDGRFIAPTGAEVVELGPCNASIHQINECVSTDDLEKLALIYEQILVDLLKNV